MRVLIDTHTLLWAVDQPAQLGVAAATTLQDPVNELLLSAATLWEIAIKVGLKKLTLSLPYREWITRAMGDLGLTVLPVTMEYADVLVRLASYHRDPFDRLIVAQAMAENIPIVTVDSIFGQYGVNRIWD
jgi:PIN domain nuclease of toxin-antitoxin system